LKQLKDLAEQDPEVKKILLNPAVRHTEAASLIGGFDESSVRRWRSKTDWKYKPPLEAPEVPGEDPPEDDDPESLMQGKASVKITGDTGVIETGRLTERITAETGWDPVLRILGFDDPENWIVLEDTVTMASWEQSKALEDGTRSTIRLYSYRARIQRRTHEIEMADEELSDAVKRMRKKRYTINRTLGTGLGPEVGWVHHQGDEQAGKDKNNGGLQRLEDVEAFVLESSIKAMKSHMKRGANIVAILDNAAGDRIENIFGHYPSQGRTTETLRKQKAYATESDIARTEVFAELGLPITKVYTPSNHGEMRQVLSQPSFSSESDNWDLIIAEDVKRVIDRSPIADQITWHIPHDEPVTYFDFCGVGLGATHGHKADGKNLPKWVLGQRDKASYHDDFKARIMLMGHKHHFHLEDVSGTMLVQTSSLDTGSRFFEDGYGIKATGGALAFLVGPHFSTYMDSLTFL